MRIGGVQRKVVDAIIQESHTKGCEHRKQAHIHEQPLAIPCETSSCFVMCIHGIQERCQHHLVKVCEEGTFVLGRRAGGEYRLLALGFGVG